MSDSVKPQAIRYCYPEAETAEIHLRLAMAGAGARLSFRIDHDDRLLARVVPHPSAPEDVTRQLAALPEINNAHRCPPFDDCPP